MNVRNLLAVSLLLFTNAFLGFGCTYGSKISVGPPLAPVPASNVQILTKPPNRAYRQVGIVSVAGANLSLESQIYRKLQKAAADLGADAVVNITVSEMSLGRGSSTRGEAIKFE